MSSYAALDVDRLSSNPDENDFKTEIVLPVTTADIGYRMVSENADETTYLYYVKHIGFFDEQYGDIDLTYNSRDEQAGKKSQGIQPGYTRESRVWANTREEDNWLVPNTSKTTAYVNSKETISRDVELNFAQPTNTISSDFQTNREETWTTQR
jgi:hypothetical protein